MDTHLVFIIAIYLVFSVIAMINEINRIRKTGIIGIITFCRVLYILFVAIVPIIIFCGYLQKGITAYLKYEDRYIWTFYVGAFYTVLTYLMFSFGYHIKQKDVAIKKRSFTTKITILSTIFVLVSIMSLFLWASGFGGVGMLIMEANSIRAGFIGSSTNVAFFKHFVPLSMLAAFLIFDQVIVKKASKRIVYLLLLFVISTIISIIYILANDGRMLAGIFIMLFFLILIKNDYEVKKKSLKTIILKTILLVAVVMLIILNADYIFRTMRGVEVLRNTQDNSLVDTVSDEFAFIVSSLQNAIIHRNDGTASYMFVNDVINGCFAWLPTSLKPISMVDVWDYNTSLLSTGGYGQTPTSIVAQAVYDLGFIGVLFIPTIYGMLIKKIEKILSSYKNNSFISTVYIVLGFYLAKGMAYFSLYNIMMNVFFIIVGCIIFTVLNKVTIGKGRTK